MLPPAIRGIVVASGTNRARTQMTEGFLRALTGGRVFVCSGGARRSTNVLPQAASVMSEVGIDISGQTPSTLGVLLDRMTTYDVFVTIDSSRSGNNSVDREGCLGGNEVRQNVDLCFPSLPTHWSTGATASDAVEKWTLWSPRDPKIFHERSMRKFQDHLYEGEPLFCRFLNGARARQQVRHQERWIIGDVSAPRPMERSSAFLSRVRLARDACFHKSVDLLRLLEAKHDGALVNESVLLSLSGHIRPTARVEEETGVEVRSKLVGVT